jgi:membrane associated rhomboid family serine protease
MMLRAINVAARSRTSGAEEVVFGALFALMGSTLLFFHRRLRVLYRAMTRDHSPVVFLSAYLVPTVFVIAGTVMIVFGFVGPHQ